MSAATVQMATQRVQGQITPVVQAIRQALLGVPALNVDESGLRVMKLLQWLHVACTNTLVWMARHAKHGMAAFDALELLAQYHGVRVHDGWQPYGDLVCLHALCNAHHLRELFFLAEELQTTDGSLSQRLSRTFAAHHAATSSPCGQRLRVFERALAARQKMTALGACLRHAGVF